MASVSAFEPGDVAGVVALWRSLHPDWAWLDDPAQTADAFARRHNREPLRYVVRRDDEVVATAFASRVQDTTWTRNRFIDVQGRPEHMHAGWLRIVLASLDAADRGQPGTWHVVNAAPG